MFCVGVVVTPFISLVSVSSGVASGMSSVGITPFSSDELSASDVCIGFIGVLFNSTVSVHGRAESDVSFINDCGIFVTSWSLMVLSGSLLVSVVSVLFSLVAISSKSMSGFSLSKSGFFSVTPCTVIVPNTGVMYSSSEGFLSSIELFVTPDKGTSCSAGSWLSMIFSRSKFSYCDDKFVFVSTIFFWAVCLGAFGSH